MTIRDELHEILELVPCVPRLHKLNGLLRGREYDEGHEEDEQPEELIEEMIVDRDGGVSQEIDRPVGSLLVLSWYACI